MAKQLLEREFTTSEGTRIEILAWKVPKSEKYPERIKYKFQAFNPENHKTILRYDNHNKHAGSQHHKHIGEEKTKPLEFETIKLTYQKFMEELKDYE